MYNHLMQQLEKERERWVLWLPVLLGAGIGIYFALPHEPSDYSLLVLPHLVLLWAWGYRRQTPWALWVGILLIVSAGFVLASWHAHSSDLVMLQKEVRISTVSGRVINVEEEQKAHKITLENVTVDGLAAEQTPHTIRLKVRGVDEPPALGAEVQLRAGLMPPSGPVMPGAFDFARFFYFRDIGAVGYGLPPVTTLSPAQEATAALWLRQQRLGIASHVRANMSTPESEVAVALMTGERTGIPEYVNEAMRSANLSHVLAISGMHMAMVTGFVFLLVRFVLVLIPATQHKRYNKQYAAAIALLAGVMYLGISGFPLSAVRAFVMVALLLGAVLLNRQVTPMRSLAFAALIILVYDPSNLLEPGFQLSFAATVALIAFYEAARFRYDAMGGLQHFRGRVLAFFVGVLLTTIVAEAATSPFVLYHFNSFSLYGLLANMLVIPVVTFWIMPAMLLSFMLMPLGLDAPALWLMEEGITTMLMLAEWVANIPHARTFYPAMPAWGMVLIALGGLWLCLWRTGWRWWGAGAIAAGLMSLSLTHMPDILISPDVKQIAVRIEGTLYMAKGRSTSFIADQWAHGAGYEQLDYVPKGNPAWQCDALGCIYTQHGQVIAFPARQSAIVEDCERADWVITAFYANACEATLIDRADLSVRGAHWFWLNETGVKMGNSAQASGVRPWARKKQRY
ncbi:MAG: hypothetical protein CMM94_05125 [Rickettsiales bacterium]|nr:hypothetical protein [Rickettsiales bacterium]